MESQNLRHLVSSIVTKNDKQPLCEHMFMTELHDKALREFISLYEDNKRAGTNHTVHDLWQTAIAMVVHLHVVPFLEKEYNEPPSQGIRSKGDTSNA